MLLMKKLQHYFHTQVVDAEAVVAVAENAIRTTMTMSIITTVVADVAVIADNGFICEQNNYL